MRNKMGNNNNNRNPQTSQHHRMNVDELKKMVNEAVKQRLDKTNLLEGPNEIGVRIVMEDLKDVIVGSITEDIVRQTSKDEKFIENVVANGYEAMVREIVRSIDRIDNVSQSVGAPVRRRTVFVPK